MPASSLTLHEWSPQAKTRSIDNELGLRSTTDEQSYISKKQHEQSIQLDWNDKDLVAWNVQMSGNR
jgi:hypothetical protein